LRDGVIERRAAAQHAEDDLREQRHFAWIAKEDGAALEKHRRECAGVLDPSQDLERLTPRVRDAQSDLPDPEGVR